MKTLFFLTVTYSLYMMMTSCGRIDPSGAPSSSDTGNAVLHFITLDPGHFHAALVQKTMYPAVDPVVHVYAPGGQELDQHMAIIGSYNTRAENPTHWTSQVYTGSDYLERMLREKAGNVVVISGNNRMKADYILASIQGGFNVLADKPMAIDSHGFGKLRKAFEMAGQKNLLLYDIMTERFEITTMLQRELSLIPEIFGTLVKGTPDEPAVTKESVHHFYKYVSGKVLTRPAWFMDVLQQGEGIVDVTTHLVDLIQWECFPGQIIDYTRDIQVESARHWATAMTLREFSAITGYDEFPSFLRKDLVNDTTLQVFCNGEIRYRLRGVHARVSVAWAYSAPAGGGDTHYSILRGTKANLIIRQGKEQQYKPALFIEPVRSGSSYERILRKRFALLQSTYPGIELRESDRGWEVIIPREYREDHEAHFSRVTANFIEYLRKGNMPAWEVPNMIAKYYTTTTALELASGL